ncbi:molybdopterin-guanine dinucleotide biosynthesis protein B [Paenibacillus sp. GCM10027629]|uniref:molybdopterin-guanine dinucleotide biosynthesis protein B n=1 Tax=Paenibacillus sp. GCM10027629 TaxID=3273414 RepID=UPI003642FE60
MILRPDEDSVLPTVPVLQIIGYKNSGKTTLACKLIEALTAQGIRVGSAKHDAHEFRLDDPETDSEQHLLHGALETVLTSSSATRTMRRTKTSLGEIAQQLHGRVDILIAEGFKAAHYPKIALIHRFDEISDLFNQAVDIRLWVSWEDPKNAETTAFQASGTSLPPILHIKNQEIVLQEALFLASSLI